MATFGERDLEELDPLRLDREIARTAADVLSFQRRLRTGEGYDDDPFFTHRLIAGRTAFQAISGMPESDPLRVPLLRWVYRFTDTRINLASTIRSAAELRLAEHVVTQPERERLTLRAVWQHALTEPRRRRAWLDSYLGAAETLGTVEAIRLERRAEIAARLGIAGPDAMEGTGADPYAAAESWLARTDDAFGSIARDSLDGAVSLLLAEDAPGDFPRHLLPRTIQEFFRDTELLRSVDLDPDPLPEPIAPASFLRALNVVFTAWATATAPKDQPFVIAHDPTGLARRVFGALFGTLPAETAFARRAFNVDKAKLGDYRRKFAASLLLESRVLALRVLLRRAAFEGRRAFGQLFESGTERAIGVALPPPAAGAIFRCRDDDPQRLAGTLLAASRATELRDQYDEDWYRNPRAVERLRDEARLPPLTTTTDEAIAAGAASYYAALASAL